MAMSSKHHEGKYTATQRHRIYLTFACIGILLCIYLILPIFSAVHVEGFTAQTESIAMLLSKAPGIEHDPYLPLVSQFIYQTRSAVVDLLAIIYGVFPTAGDLAFKGLVLASFIVLFISSVVFAKQWGNLPLAFPAFALILTPGIPETAFFFNDNIVSAAFSTVALTLISKESKIQRWLLSGIFMGFAILSRVDAVLILPIVFGVIFYSIKNHPRKFLAGAVLSLGTVCVLAISAVHHGFSLIDVFFLAKKFVLPQDENRWFAIQFWARLHFIGLVSIPLLCIGLWIGLKRFKSERSYIGVLTFIGYPVVLAIFAPKATEARYVFPLLSSMIALHIGIGLQWVYLQCLGSTNRKAYIVAWGVTVFAVAVSVFPPTHVRVSDGPRVLLGRIWSPGYWKRWQASVDESTTRAKALSEELAQNHADIVISTHYNDEFYLRLRLIEAGFVPVATSLAFPGCNGFSVLQKGDSTVAHIRTDPQYRISPVSINYNAALQITSALKCPKLQSSENIYITTFGINLRGMAPEIYGKLSSAFVRPLAVSFEDLSSNITSNNKDIPRDYGLLDFKKLSKNEINDLTFSAKSYLSRYPEYDPKTHSLLSIEAYSRSYSAVQGPTSKKLIDVAKTFNIGLAGNK